MDSQTLNSLITNNLDFLKFQLTPATTDLTMVNKDDKFYYYDI